MEILKSFLLLALFCVLAVLWLQEFVPLPFRAPDYGVSLLIAIYAASAHKRWTTSSD